METQTRLSRHNKSISAENIVGIFSASSNDSFTCSVLSRKGRERITSEKWVYVHLYQCAWVTKKRSEYEKEKTCILDWTLIFESAYL